MKKEQEKLWTKSFVSIWLTQFFLFVVFYTLLTTLPIYVMNDLGKSQSNAGLVVTFILIAAILIRPFSAKILDIFGKKRALVASVILFTLTTFFYIAMKEFVPLLILRFIHGISFGIVTTATGAIAADIIPKARHGAGMGYFAVSMNLAVVVGPFIGLTILQFVSFQILFLVLNGLVLIVVVCSFIVQVPEAHAESQQTTKQKFKLQFSDLIEVRALRVAFFSGLVGMAYASVLSFVSVYAEELDLASTASYFFLVFAIVMIVFRPYLGRTFDEKGPKIVLVPCLFIFAIGLALLGMTNTSLLLLISAGLIGLGYGTLLPGFQTLSIQSTSPERSGHAISTFYVFYDSGIAIGAFVWGIVSSGFGFDNMYFVSALLIVITAVLFNYFLKKQKNSSKELFNKGSS